MATRPLNGERTRALTHHAIDALQRLRRSSHVPRQEFNPGIVDRLTRGGLAEIIDAPSPYKTRRGTIQALRITEAGLQELGV
jgi:hypothetical protein